MLSFAALGVSGSRHPNEDAWAADPTRGRFAVCDGVTSTFLPNGAYPAWAGGGRAAWLAAAALAAAADGDPLAALTTALATADRLIGALNAARDDGPIDYWEHDVYNATAVAAILEPALESEHRTLNIVCLGDAAALLQPADGPPRLLTRVQTAAAEHLRDRILRRGGMSDRDRVVLFRRDLRNFAEPWTGPPLPDAFTPAGCAFGVLDGTGRYLPHVERLALEMAPGDRLYLCSDTVGAALADRAAAGQPLPTEPADVVELTRAWEHARRAAYQDDATVLIVQV